MIDFELVVAYPFEQEGKFMAVKQLTCRELVLEKYPTAVVDDDGEWIRIRYTEEKQELCPHCKQPWTHSVISLVVLGSAGNEVAAWEDAARSLIRKS